MTPYVTTLRVTSGARSRCLATAVTAAHVQHGVTSPDHGGHDAGFVPRGVTSPCHGDHGDHVPLRGPS